MSVTTPQLPSYRRREEEQQWREQGKYLVVFFGMLGYETLAICDTEEEANELHAAWVVCAVLGSLAKGKADLGMRLKGWTRHVSPHDIQVRTQESLDHLTAAIIGSYPVRYSR